MTFVILGAIEVFLLTYWQL